MLPHTKMTILPDSEIDGYDFCLGDPTCDLFDMHPTATKPCNVETHPKNRAENTEKIWRLTIEPPGEDFHIF